jgi:hypothetical protein
MRRISIPRPFAGGYKTDVPDYALALNEASYAQDMAAPLGIARQRWGWNYVGSAVTGSNPTSSAKNYFAVPQTTVTTFAGSNGRIYAQAADLSWNAITPLVSPSTEYIPRCVYNGEIIYCAQDGVSPLVRYAGVQTFGSSVSSGVTLTMNAGSMTVIASSSQQAYKGGFFTALFPTSSGGYSKNPAMSSRVIEASGTNVTLESLRNKTSSNASAAVSYVSSSVGYAYPAVVVSEVGKVSSVSGTSVNFEGTNFSNSEVRTLSNANVPFGSADSLLIQNTTTGSPHEIADIVAVSTTVQLTTHVALSGFSNAAFKQLRRCPFKDAAVHRGSLWGTGVKQYPNRVYVFVPTKDIGLPPAAEKPFDPTLQAGYSSTNVQGFVRVQDFLAGAYDVPGPYDSTPVVAILSSPGPLLALKSDSVYGLYGTYDATNPSSIEVNRISEGSGCVDIRSAITVESVPYWAGDDGIFSYRNGQIANLTEGRIQREWEALMRGYVGGQSWVSIGLAGTSYLVVSCGGLDGAKTSGAKNGPDTSNPTSRTLVYDLRLNVWLGRMTNFNPKHMWSVNPEDGGPALHAVGDSNYPSRIVDAYPAYFSGDQTDDDGTGPRFKAWSTASLAQADGVEGEARFCDVVLHANLLDASTPTSTLDVSIVSGGQLLDQATATKSLTAITADTADRVDRFKRTVNRSGRLHQIRLDMSVTDSTNEKSEIPEIVMSFRDTRRGT